jgi:NADPH:quinone reductase-like Zn-dependent oxidoreductase
VLATASGGNGVSLAQSLGADDVVDGKSDKFKAAIEKMAPKGVDAVLGLVGGETLAQCLKILRRGGRCAYPNGVEPEPDEQHGIEIVPYDAVSSSKKFEQLNQAVEDIEDFQVPIADSYALEFASTAHKRLGGGHVPGKIVLRILR